MPVRTTTPTPFPAVITVPPYSIPLACTPIAPPALPSKPSPFAGSPRYGFFETLSLSPVREASSTVNVDVDTDTSRMSAGTFCPTDNSTTSPGMSDDASTSTSSTAAALLERLPSLTSLPTSLIRTTAFCACICFNAEIPLEASKAWYPPTKALITNMVVMTMGSTNASMICLMLNSAAGGPAIVPAGSPLLLDAAAAASAAPVIISFASFTTSSAIEGG
mmetsp:Transcript_1941/g.3538  ORF Transcript_1941/g.3538 Transcript_1941/m.3538 type:complete len:220 (-) Transcript_1941:829-1488(-)